ncbi:MAG TPA: alpha/beta hydrolase family protein [Pyrinomonadaceae bacterium]|nr:alpha/beta hydrolase family protein [Pyrinomonadaceae bacterium]
MPKKSSTLFLLFALLLPAVAHAQTPDAQVKADSSAVKKDDEPRRYETVRFESKLVGAMLPYNVVLPADYAHASTKQTRYPVLYLLHGLGGGANDWVSARAHLADHAARYTLIIVVPEGRDGWYTDSASAANEKFESYFVEELIGDVERRFRAIAAREGRGVAGLSMGGYGALKFGLKHPNVFAFAASLSGALAVADRSGEEPSYTRPSVASVFGPPGSPTRRANDIFRLVRELTPERVRALPYFYLDCGTEDFFFGDSRDFSALLIEKKIPHEFREMPGTHGWPYWDRQVQEVLKIAAQKLASAREAKATSGR